MHITIIGSGNVATHLAAALKNAGHKIIQVYSPNQHNAAILAYHVGAKPVSDLSNIDGAAADLFIISVKDDVITDICRELSVYQKLIVHTSGATPMLPGDKRGVFYPLQTFSKTKELDFSQVPLCIEGSDEQVTAMLEQLAYTLSRNVYRVNSSQRKILHLAAVFACNFPNALYAIAQGLLAEHQLDFNLLRPLILETAEKVQQSLPAEVQTGPAVRRDQKTMNDHMQLLSPEPVLQDIYQILSQRIIKMDNALKGDE
ncbi:oxidoreductase [Mucilaginibacter sp. PPCGB 2223]|uniref:Rossmann-like and DUF2520 domain-containing protein n=1 Tax=Mucilaginibacter sp. PPCGB 2223 TaxID=1886027 RepID=UPI000825CC88|nr:Rossmann-like and DUF2520 domain-containing protein [Mucilaginibacter sp. PPCGB 2223]OCX53334.1 oxidoreductase [Mucilaginibacter sp. PPCGB 2223]